MYERLALAIGAAGIVGFVSGAAVMGNHVAPAADPPPPAPSPADAVPNAVEGVPVVGGVVHTVRGGISPDQQCAVLDVPCRFGRGVGTMADQVPLVNTLV